MGTAKKDGEKSFFSNSSNLIWLLRLNHLHATKLTIQSSSSWHQQTDLHPLQWKCYYSIEYGTSSLMGPNSRSPTNTGRASKITIPLRSHGVDMIGFHLTEKGWRIFQKFPILNWVSENYSFVCSLALHIELHTAKRISVNFMKKQTILGRKSTFSL